MKAVIIVIGDEILMGDTIDTNSSWIAGQLDGIGVQTTHIQTIGDDAEQMFSVLDEALNQTDLVLITGGLGPTHDDITKQTLNQYFKDELVFNEAVFQDITDLISRFGRAVNEFNRQQAFVPSKCEVIQNKRGTAPGMIFSQQSKVVISMPGVPNEMREMMRSKVLTYLKSKGIGRRRIHKYIKTFGVAEATLAERLKPLTDQLPEHIRLAYLPSPGHVKLRFSASSQNKDDVESQMEAIITEFRKEIGRAAYGDENDDLESVVGELLNKAGKSLATAESCTGGSLAGRITSVPGSSTYYMGSVVSYSNEAKTTVLRVNESVLEKQGAVSEEVVCEMAEGVRELMQTSYALATSGIAGPDGGTREKPVGTIWLAMAGPAGCTSKKLQLGFDRRTNISLTVDHALNMLRKELIERFEDN